MGDELKWILNKGGGHIFKSCDISLESTPTSHVSLALVMFACNDPAMLRLCNNSKWYLPSFVSLFSCCFVGASHLHNSMYCCINRWAYFQEKSTLCNNFVQKWGVGLLSRVGLFSEITTLVTNNHVY